MSRPSSAWALALASRLLMRVAVWLLGPQQAAWAQAMQSEIAAVGNDREALAFAWGCMGAALGHALGYALGAARGRLAQCHHAGALACSAAVLTGCAFMHSAGAPRHYVWVNLLSLAFGLATLRLLPRPRLQADALLRAQLSLAMGALLLIASLGQVSTVASAWLRIGPVPLNLSWLLLPALLVASDAGSRTAARPWALGGLSMASGALALMADALLMGVVAAVLSLRAWHRRDALLGLLAGATSVTAVLLGPRWQAPQASAFVDRVLQSGLEQSVTAGLALTLLQVLLLWPAWQHRQARVHGLVWALLLALSVPGWLPSPLVGFGGSFIVAYLLSLAMVSSDTEERAPARSWPAAARSHQDPPTWPRSGVT